jgi:integrase/recombinase XerD
VKVKRNGQATPLDKDTYELISESLPSELHRLFFAIAWYTGERPQAILKLEVNNVYQNCLLRLPREKIIFPAHSRKGRATREIFTHRALKLILCAYQPPPSGFLFPSYSRARHLSRQAMDKAFRKALEAASLQNQGFSLYSFRRGFITHLYQKGFGIKTIQALTGHKSISSLVKYIDVTESQLKNAISNF